MLRRHSPYFFASIFFGLLNLFLAMIGGCEGGDGSDGPPLLMALMRNWYSHPSMRPGQVPWILPSLTLTSSTLRVTPCSQTPPVSSISTS